MTAAVILLAVGKLVLMGRILSGHRRLWEPIR